MNASHAYPHGRKQADGWQTDDMIDVMLYNEDWRFILSEMSSDHHIYIDEIVI